MNNCFDVHVSNDTIGIFVAILGVICAIATPEIRRLIGLDRNVPSKFLDAGGASVGTVPIGRLSIACASRYIVRLVIGALLGFVVGAYLLALLIFLPAAVIIVLAFQFCITPFFNYDVINTVLGQVTLYGLGGAVSGSLLGSGIGVEAAKYTTLHDQYSNTPRCVIDLLISCVVGAISSRFAGTIFWDNASVTHIIYWVVAGVISGAAVHLLWSVGSRSLFLSGAIGGSAGVVVGTIFGSLDQGLCAVPSILGQVPFHEGKFVSILPGLSTVGAIFCSVAGPTILAMRFR